MAKLSLKKLEKKYGISYQTLLGLLRRKIITSEKVTSVGERTEHRVDEREIADYLRQKFARPTTGKKLKSIVIPIPPLEEEIQAALEALKPQDQPTEQIIQADPQLSVAAEETQPEETQPEETQPEETQPEETQPEETQPEETQPEETQPEETQPEETQPEEPPKKKRKERQPKLTETPKKPKKPPKKAKNRRRLHWPI